MDCVPETSGASQLGQEMKEEVLVVGDVLGGALGDGHFEVVPEPLNVIALEKHSIDPTSVGVYPVARGLPEVITDH